MSRGINLLGIKKQVVLSPLARKLKLLRFFSIWLLFGISAASVVLFLLIALSPLPSLQEQEQRTLVTLGQEHANVAKLLLIADRLNSSAGIIRKRPDYATALRIVREKMPAGMSVTALTMKDKDVSVTVSSSSLTDIDTFFSNLIGLVDPKGKFSDVSLTTLTAEGNTYLVTVNLLIL